MELVLAHAEAVLRQHPTAAMDLLELHQRTRERFSVGMPSPTRLRRLLESEPHRFRVVDPWTSSDATAHPAPDDAQPEAGVLVVSLEPLAGAVSRTPEHRLTESLRWVARRTGVRSLRTGARIYRLLDEGASVHRRLVKRAA